MFDHLTKRDRVEMGVREFHAFDAAKVKLQAALPGEFASAFIEIDICRKSMTGPSIPLG
jgi:hypothetical protein